MFWISSKKLKKLTDKIESAEKEVADLKAQLGNHPKAVEDALTQPFMEEIEAAAWEGSAVGGAKDMAPVDWDGHTLLAEEARPST